MSILEIPELSEVVLTCSVSLSIIPHTHSSHVFNIIIIIIIIIVSAVVLLSRIHTRCSYRVLALRQTSIHHHDHCRESRHGRFHGSLPGLFLFLFLFLFSSSSSSLANRLTDLLTKSLRFIPLLFGLAYFPCACIAFFCFSYASLPRLLQSLKRKPLALGRRRERLGMTRSL